MIQVFRLKPLCYTDNMIKGVLPVVYVGTYIAHFIMKWHIKKYSDIKACGCKSILLSSYQAQCWRLMPFKGFSRKLVSQLVYSIYLLHSVHCFHFWPFLFVFSKNGTKVPKHVSKSKNAVFNIFCHCFIVFNRLRSMICIFDNCHFCFIWFSAPVAYTKRRCYARACVCVLLGSILLIYHISFVVALYLRCLSAGCVCACRLNWSCNCDVFQDVSNRRCNYVVVWCEVRMLCVSVLVRVCASAILIIFKKLFHDTFTAG